MTTKYYKGDTELSDEQVLDWLEKMEKLVEYFGSQARLARWMEVDNGGLHRAMSGKGRPGKSYYEKGMSLYKRVEKAGDSLRGREPSVTETVEDAVEADIPATPTGGNGNRYHHRIGVIARLEESAEALDDLIVAISSARDAYKVFERKMGLAHQEANAIVGRGIQAVMDELVETKRFLDDATV